MAYILVRIIICNQNCPYLAFKSVTYTQMRARTELGNAVNDWTTVEIRISTIPPDVMTGIRVSNISHVITSGATGPMVTIKARMMWTPPSVVLGNVTGYHLWVGERPLKLNENPSGYKAFEV